MVTYMLPVAELLSVGSEPLERSIWANLRKKPRSVTEIISLKLKHLNAVIISLMSTNEDLSGTVAHQLKFKGCSKVSRRVK